MTRNNVLQLLALGTLVSMPLMCNAQISMALQQATVKVSRPDSNAAVSGTVWLALPEQAGLDQALTSIYTPALPAYHHFLTWTTLEPYLPTPGQRDAVLKQLASHNLKVTAVDSHNLSVSFEGQTGDFENAFSTTIEMRRLANGKQVRAFTVAPTLGNDDANLIRAVTGVFDTVEEPAITPPRDPTTGVQIGMESLEEARSETTTAAGPPYYCFFPPAFTLLTTPGQPQPYAAYLGPLYSARLSDGKLSSVKECSYTPAQFFFQTGLDNIHSAGYTGAGQTIAILEQVGSSTLASDLQAFDQLYGLPPANLQVINLTTGNPVSVAVNETTLDVEWAHAVAPAAKIVVVDTNPDELVNGLAYVVNNRLADIVSISYGATELTSSPDLIQAWNEELELASSLHINVDVASGDYGDRVEDEGQADVNVPADSPYATAIGGLSVAYAPGSSLLLKSSWGTDFSLIGTGGVPLVTPLPIPHGGNKFGSGGGISAKFPLPTFQSALGGTGRHVPDISDIADPHTGLKIVVTDPACTSEPCVETEGGTSLATPVFSAKWALLNQLYGFPLGQAAPLIAQYSQTSAVEDIVPLPSTAAVVGAVVSSAGVQIYSAAQLASPETAQPYVSALWQQEIDGDAKNYVISFGTDSSLAVTKGYDLATGWGEIDLKNIFAMDPKASIRQ